MARDNGGSANIVDNNGFFTGIIPNPNGGEGNNGSGGSSAPNYFRVPMPVQYSPQTGSIYSQAWGNFPFANLGQQLAAANNIPAPTPPSYPWAMPQATAQRNTQYAQTQANNFGPMNYYGQYSAKPPAVYSPINYSNQTMQSGGGQIPSGQGAGGLAPRGAMFQPPPNFGQGQVPIIPNSTILYPPGNNYPTTAVPAPHIGLRPGYTGYNAPGPDTDAYWQDMGYANRAAKQQENLGLASAISPRPGDMVAVRNSIIDTGQIPQNIAPQNMATLKSLLTPMAANLPSNVKAYFGL